MSGEGVLTEDERLWRVAEHLDSRLGLRLRELLDADAGVQEVVDLRARCRRAEDLAAECRRQLRSRDRQCDRLVAEVAALRAAAGTPTHRNQKEET
jgi:hypothetical protein